MYTFFSIVFGLIWAVASFLLLFKVWDVLGPIVLGISKNHIVQAAALVITYIVIFGVPAWCWVLDRCGGRRRHGPCVEQAEPVFQHLRKATCQILKVPVGSQQFSKFPSTPKLPHTVEAGPYPAAADHA